MDNHFFVLCKKLGKLCLANDVRVALAESCTGGSMAAQITNVMGCSAWFHGSAVVYSDHAKSTVLDVDPQLIKTHGAVSETVAKAMAESALQKFYADLSLAITGVAGPSGGSVKKPVGTVCFALADRKSVETKTMHFTSGRDYIRKSANIFALEWLVMHLMVR